RRRPRTDAAGWVLRVSGGKIARRCQCFRLTVPERVTPQNRGCISGNVIASAAKQSVLSLRGEMDCFAALAMTGAVGRMGGASEAGHAQPRERYPLISAKMMGFAKG